MIKKISLYFSVCIFCVMISGCAAQLAIGALETAGHLGAFDKSSGQSNMKHEKVITNKEDAKIFVDKAVAYYKSVGKIKALNTFNNPDSEFNGLEVLNMQGIQVGYNGSITGVLGSDLNNEKDFYGKYYYKEIISKCNTEGVTGYAEHAFHNMITKKIIIIGTYFVRVEDVIIFSHIFSDI